MDVSSTSNEFILYMLLYSFNKTSMNSVPNSSLGNYTHFVGIFAQWQQTDWGTPNSTNEYSDGTISLLNGIQRFEYLVPSNTMLVTLLNDIRLIDVHNSRNDKPTHIRYLLSGREMIDVPNFSNDYYNTICWYIWPLISRWNGRTQFQYDYITYYVSRIGHWHQDEMGVANSSNDYCVLCL